MTAQPNDKPLKQDNYEERAARFECCDFNCPILFDSLEIDDNEESSESE